MKEERGSSLLVNEKKLLEIIGDPDSGLYLEKGFKENLERRVRNVPRKVLHDDVLKKFV